MDSTPTWLLFSLVLLAWLATLVIAHLVGYRAGRTQGHRDGLPIPTVVRTNEPSASFVAPTMHLDAFPPERSIPVRGSDWDPSPPRPVQAGVLLIPEGVDFPDTLSFPDGSSIPVAIQFDDGCIAEHSPARSTCVNSPAKGDPHG